MGSGLCPPELGKELECGLMGDPGLGEQWILGCGAQLLLVFDASSAPLFSPPLSLRLVSA